MIDFGRDTIVENSLLPVGPEELLLVVNGQPERIVERCVHDAPMSAIDANALESLLT